MIEIFTGARSFLLNVKDILFVEKTDAMLTINFKRSSTYVAIRGEQTIKEAYDKIKEAMEANNGTKTSD